MTKGLLDTLYNAEYLHRPREAAKKVFFLFLMVELLRGEGVGLGWTTKEKNVFCCRWANSKSLKSFLNIGLKNKTLLVLKNMERKKMSKSVASFFKTTKKSVTTKPRVDHKKKKFFLRLPQRIALGRRFFFVCRAAARGSRRQSRDEISIDVSGYPIIKQTYQKKPEGADRDLPPPLGYCSRYATALTLSGLGGGGANL